MEEIKSKEIEPVKDLKTESEESEYSPYSNSTSSSQQVGNGIDNKSPFHFKVVGGILLVVGALLGGMSSTRGTIMYGLPTILKIFLPLFVMAIGVSLWKYKKGESENEVKE